MTLEELAELIRANRANTDGRIDGVNGRIDRVVDHVRDLHGYMDKSRNEANAALMNIQNDLTDVRGEIKDMRAGAADLGRDVAEVAELKQRAS